MRFKSYHSGPRATSARAGDKPGNYWQAGERGEGGCPLPGCLELQVDAGAQTERVDAAFVLEDAQVVHAEPDPDVLGHADVRATADLKREVRLRIGAAHCEVLSTEAAAAFKAARSVRRTSKHVRERDDRSAGVAAHANSAHELIELDSGVRACARAAEGRGLFVGLVVAADLRDDGERPREVAGHIDEPAGGQRLALGIG